MVCTRERALEFPQKPLQVTVLYAKYCTVHPCRRLISVLEKLGGDVHSNPSFSCTDETIFILKPSVPHPLPLKFVDLMTIFTPHLSTID